jgi:hypothetical protein
MRRRLTSLAIAMAVLSTSTTSGAAAKAIMGFGLQSCGSWIDWREHGKSLVRTAAEAWVAGYLSGLNFGGDPGLPDILLGADPPALRAWIDKYCREHPLDHLSKATETLSIELMRRIISR